MILKYRGIAYQSEHQPAIAQSHITLKFLGQPYSSTSQRQKRPTVIQSEHPIQFLGQRYSLPALSAAT